MANRSVNQVTPISPPDVFKGIALFTPGGDLIYCIDPHKHRRWHLQLCTALQDLMGLSEIPHFLVPCYAATVDRWWDARTQTLQTVAEASPRLMRYESLLNVVFGLSQMQWSYVPCADELCDPALLDTYRSRFPQLWHNHNLVVQLDQFQPTPHQGLGDRPTSGNEFTPDPPSGLVLRLFVAGYGAATEAILRKLHQILETTLQEPYTLRVVDIYRNPDQAELNQITATPTLLKVWPPPNKRIVGSLDNVDQFLSVLAPRP
ncbi:MAG: circadian clock KaiB family protein [Leptolyngbyaceae bacterium]|nr:circadian clock KaiB family protein [Leptolyngbyaceae bacterium]